jgi:spatacsin
VNLLHRLHNIVADVDVKLNYIALGHHERRDVFEGEVHRVIKILKSTSQYDCARSFAEAASVQCDDITTDELTSLLAEMRQSAAWLMEDMRFEFWRKCQAALQKHNVDSVIASQFLQAQCTDDQPHHERATLLQLAYDCLAPDVDVQTRQDVYRTLWHCRVQQYLAGQQLPCQQQGINRRGLHWTTATDQSATGCAGAVELTDVEEHGLQGVLGVLLDSGEVTEAKRVMEAFGRSFTSLNIIVACLRLLHGMVRVNDLDSDIKTLASSSIGPHNRCLPSYPSFITLPLIGHVVSSFNKAIPDSEFMDNSASANNTAETVVRRLLTHCQSGQLCCRFIMSAVKICQLTGLTFVNILQNDEFDILRSLLTVSDNSRFSLAKDFVVTLGISDTRLASFLCDVLLESIQVHTNISSTDESENIAVPTTSHSTPVLRLPQDLCSVETRSKSGFIELVQLCASSEVLGNRLIAAVKSLLHASHVVSAKLLTVQVIMLAFASDCFTIAASTTGISAVLSTAKRVVQALADVKEYLLMVCLLASIGKYNEMQYVFDILKENDKFELLFTKELCKEDQLRLAVMDYLKRFHATDTQTMALVAKNFGMHRAFAQHLEQTAGTQLQAIRGKTVARHLVDVIKNVLDDYIQAAELYAKVKSTEELRSCLQQVRLVTLQIHLLKSTAVRVVNLQTDEAIAFVKTCSKFSEACIVIDAYDIEEVWSDVLLEKVIKEGLFDYATDMSTSKRLTVDLISSLIPKYTSLAAMSGRNAPRYAANMKRLLSFCDNIRKRYQMTRHLGFADLMQEILSDECVVAYIKDPPLHKNVLFSI